jgi:hypothetical protein
MCTRKKRMMRLDSTEVLNRVLYVRVHNVLFSITFSILSSVFMTWLSYVIRLPATPPVEEGCLSYVINTSLAYCSPI